MVFELNAVKGPLGAWSLPSRPCHSGGATVYCSPHSAFLCLSCDARIHSPSKLSTRHQRAWLCHVCEQAPAAVTCKADAASLCVTCDANIHSANPLAHRHERVPVVPFSDSADFNLLVVPTHDYSDDGSGGATHLYDEIDTESLLISDPNVFFPEIDDPFVDFNFPKSTGSKLQLHDFCGADTDSVVPVQTEPLVPPAININCFNIDFCKSKLQVSSSSLDAGLVPDGFSKSEISYPFGRHEPAGLISTVSASATTSLPAQLCGMDREARVMRYREKRKNRKFEKTIRYASRKAYAETRPRIKGRFAKRTETGFESDRLHLHVRDCQYGVVPSF